jgi:uncharacterized protein (DUF1800 family)
MGFAEDRLATSLSDGLDITVGKLLDPQPLPPPPLNVSFGSDQNVPLGQSWVEAATSGSVQGYRRNSLRHWGMGMLAQAPYSFTPKMVLFWHNHFALELQIVKDARYVYDYYRQLHTYALGNFRTLVKKMTLAPAMLVYLNGNENIAGAPNENYARELFELFTIGKGPLAGPGDYTHYTEEDILAAAEALTGWRDDMKAGGGRPSALFVGADHTKGDKTFSTRFGGHVITESGATEYAQLVDMIFTREETARHLCRKLYRWLVYYEIDAQIETEVISPMAELLSASGFELMPVLDNLFKSAHFFDERFRGALIKNPVDFVTGLLYQFDVQFPDPATDLKAQYALWGEMFAEAERQQMALFDPPSVAGWQAYYQEPLFHRIWINAVTLPSRQAFVRKLLHEGFKAFGQKVEIDVLAFVNKLDPGEAAIADLLIDRLSEMVLPNLLPDAQKLRLKKAFLAGLPDYEWTIEFGDYLAEPEDPAFSEPIRLKLIQLLEAFLSLAEYQLS